MSAEADLVISERINIFKRYWILYMLLQLFKLIIKEAVSKIFFYRKVRKVFAKYAKSKH